MAKSSTAAKFQWHRDVQGRLTSTNGLSDGRVNVELRRDEFGQWVVCAWGVDARDVSRPCDLIECARQRDARDAAERVLAASLDRPFRFESQARAAAYDSQF